MSNQNIVTFSFWTFWKLVFILLVWVLLERVCVCCYSNVFTILKNDINFRFQVNSELSEITGYEVDHNLDTRNVCSEVTYFVLAKNATRHYYYYYYFVGKCSTGSHQKFKNFVREMDKDYRSVLSCKRIFWYLLCLYFLFICDTTHFSVEVFFFLLEKNVS